MRVSHSLLFAAVVAMPVAAQGTGYYVPDNAAGSGGCNAIPFGSTGASGTWLNQRYQTIATSADLGGMAGLITGLGVAPCNTGENRTQHLTITLAHVPPGYSLPANTNFLTNLAAGGPGAMVVLSQSDYRWPLTTNAWSNIGFDSSFFYNGVDDLLIDIIAEGNDNGSSSGSMRTGGRDRLYIYNWTGTPPATGRTSPNGIKIQVKVGCADISTFGSGCGGLELSLSGSSAIGQTLNIGASGGAANQMIALNIGTTNSTPFPIDGASFGVPGCWLLCDALASVSLTTTATGTASVALPVPGNYSGYGLRLFYQYVHFNPSVTVPIVLSNGGRSVIGPGCP